MYSPNGPSGSVSPGMISPSITSSAVAGTRMSLVTAFVTSTGAPRSAPAISYSLSVKPKRVLAHRNRVGSAPQT